MSVEERRLRLMQAIGLEPLQAVWQWFLALGVIMIILGIAAIALPGITTLATEVFIGWIVLLGGVVQTVSAFWARRWGGFFLALLSGILFLVVGALMLAYPVMGILALTLLLGVLFLLQGAFEITLAVAVRPSTSWGWLLVSGILSLLIAFLILANWPSAAAWAIGLLVGVALLWYGLARVMLALAARSALRHTP